MFIEQPANCNEPHGSATCCSALCSSFCPPPKKEKNSLLSSFSSPLLSSIRKQIKCHFIDMIINLSDKRWKLSNIFCLVLSGPPTCPNKFDFRSKDPSTRFSINKQTHKKEWLMFLYKLNKLKIRFDL